MQPNTSTQTAPLRQLYPQLTEDQLQAAEYNLRRYVAVMARIYERVRVEQGPEAARRLAYGDLTPSETSSSV